MRGVIVQGVKNPHTWRNIRPEPIILMEELSFFENLCDLRIRLTTFSIAQDKNESHRQPKSRQPCLEIFHLRQSQALRGDWREAVETGWYWIL